MTGGSRKGQRMSFRFDLLVHAANVLYLLAFMVRDIVLLRVLTVIAIVCLIPYYYSRPEPMMVAIYWNLGFLALNLYWIARLLGSMPSPHET